MVASQIVVIGDMISSIKLSDKTEGVACTRTHKCDFAKLTKYSISGNTT